MVKKIQSKKKKNSSREISSELTHWMSAGNSSKVKHAVFSTFHRILDDLMITETTAKALIIFQIIQLLAITVNQDNTVLSLHIPKSLLGFMNFSLVYPLLESVNIYTSSLFIIPIVLYLFWVIWGFSAIYNLPEKEHKKYGGLKQNYGLGLYLIDSILVSSCSSNNEVSDLVKNQIWEEKWENLFFILILMAKFTSLNLEFALSETILIFLGRFAHFLE